MSSKIPGFEIFFNSIKNNLSSQEDAVVAAVHFVLIWDQYSCIGINEEGPEDEGSECLPDGWNQNQDVWTLRYRKKSTSGPNVTYLLKIIQAESCLLINFMRRDTEDVAFLAVETHQYTTDDLKNLKRTYQDLDQLVDLVKSELCRISAESQPKAASSGGQLSASEKLRDTSRDHPPAFRGRADPHHPDLAAPSHGGVPGEWSGLYGVGRGDLDPLGAGGGMIFDPLRSGIPRFDPSRGIPGHLPRGAVPPGARFDPPAPFNPGTQPGRGFGGVEPDPDHLRPPGYDDMFM